MAQQYSEAVITQRQVNKLQTKAEYQTGERQENTLLKAQKLQEEIEQYVQKSQEEKIANEEFVGLLSIALEQAEKNGASKSDITAVEATCQEMISRNKQIEAELTAIEEAKNTQSNRKSTLSTIQKGIQWGIEKSKDLIQEANYKFKTTALGRAVYVGLPNAVTQVQIATLKHEKGVYEKNILHFQKDIQKNEAFIKKQEDKLEKRNDRRAALYSIIGKKAGIKGFSNKIQHELDNRRAAIDSLKKSLENETNYFLAVTEQISEKEAKINMRLNRNISHKQTKEDRAADESEINLPEAVDAFAGREDNWDMYMDQTIETEENTLAGFEAKIVDNIQQEMPLESLDERLERAANQSYSEKIFEDQSFREQNEFEPELV